MIINSNLYDINKINKLLRNEQPIYLYLKLPES